MPAPDYTAPPAVNIANLLEAVFESFRAELADRDSSGLRSSQLRFLTRVPDEGVRLGDMAPLASMTKAASGQFAAALEERGLVEITVDPADSRARIVRRTETGRALAQSTLLAVAEIEDLWRHRLGAERYDALRDSLQAIAASSNTPTGTQQASS